MDSFYGGHPGISFIIVERYDSIKDMLTAFAKGGDYDKVRYGQYVIIDTVINLNDKSSLENGLIFCRGFNYQEPFAVEPNIEDYDQGAEGVDRDAYELAMRKYFSKPGAGAIYIGQIAGPQGETPYLEFLPESEVKALDDKYKGTGDIDIVSGKDHDKITYAYCNIRDKHGNYAGCALGFTFPYHVIEINGESLSPYDEERGQYNKEQKVWSYTNLIEKQSGNDDNRPFYSEWKLLVPKGIHGADLLSIGVEEDTQQYYYQIKDYNASEAGDTTKYLMEGIYHKVIDEVTFDREKVEFVIKYTTGDEDRVGAEFLNDLVEQAGQSAKDAAASAEAAKVSETKAKASEDAAKLSETAAGIFAGNAEESADVATENATAASESASNAENSAVAAKASQDAAKASQTAAAESASAAQQSQAAASTSAQKAEAAQGKAETAQSSAEAAAQEAQTAQTMAETAQKKAEAAQSNAEDAETTAEAAAQTATEKAAAASTSATNAKTSETVAKASETAAKTAQTAAETAQGKTEDARDMAEMFKDSASESADEAAASALASASSSVSAEAAQKKAETAASTATTQANAASGSAASAKTAQTAAETARDAAKSAQTSAESARDAAKTAQTGAESAKSAATTSASNAAKSAQAAADSEDAALTAQESAETAAQTATEKATAASTSATAASTSAANAKASETAAKTAQTTAQTASDAAQTAKTAAETAKAGADASKTAAATSATQAENSKKLSQSYAEGGTGVRDNEATNNSKYYYEQTLKVAQGLKGSLIPMGTIKFSELATAEKVSGYMYNISEAFTSDNTFEDGGGHLYGAGSNVYYTASGKWDVLAAPVVSGVKGDSESTYRQGNVNITKGNIGLGNVDNTADSVKNVASAKTANTADYLTPHLIAEGTDLDTLKTSGIYYTSQGSVAPTLKNCPITSSISITLLVMARESIGWTQLLIGSVGFDVFARSTANQTWSSWYRLYSTGAKPTPADIGALAATAKAESAKTADSVAWTNVTGRPNRAGSATDGGSANSAVKLDSSAGSATKPVYFAEGKPVACTHSLNVDVPTGAKFTDTTYTAGAGLTLTGTTFTPHLGATASNKTYPVKTNTSGQLVVDVPWTDNNTTYSAGSGMTLSGTTFNVGKRWTATTQGQKWSRIYYSVPTQGTIGSSGILSIGATRSSVVVNATFLVSVSHPNASASVIVELASTNYSPIKVRMVANTNGVYYFEIYDTNQNIASGTTQTWQCCYIPILDSTLTVYTAFTDGTSIPSGFTAGNDFTTAKGNDSIAIRNITRSGTTYTATRQNGSSFTFDQDHDYNNLINKPTIPAAAANARLTINQGDTLKGTFTANASQDVTINLSDNNTTYSAGTGLTLTGTSFAANTGATTSGRDYAVKTNSAGQLIVNVPWTDNNTTYGTYAGSGVGLVPARAAGGTTTKYLREDGSWQVPPNTWRGIQDNLTSSSTTDSLSANQGKLLASGSARDNTKVAKTGDTMTGTLRIKPGAVSGWTEGLQIHEADNKWCTIRLGGSTDSGTADNIWSIHKNATDDFTVDRNDSSGINGFIIKKSGLMGLGTISPTVKLDVVGQVKASAGFVGSLTGNATTATTATTANQVAQTLTFTGGVSKTYNGSTAQSVAIPIVDTALNSTSVNALQNKVIYTELAKKQNALYKQVVDLTAATYNQDTWYPVTGTALHRGGLNFLRLAVELNSGSNATWSTHGGDFTCNMELYVKYPGYGTTNASGHCTEYSCLWTKNSVNPAGFTIMSNSSTPVFYLRGGGKYPLYTDYSCTWTIHTTAYTATSQTVEPKTTSPGVGIVLSTIYANLYGSVIGNASTATALGTMSVGNATQPVYFASGKPVACTYTLGTSVPAGAKFTDTTYTLDSFGITASATELNYTKGVTSNIQTQLNGKAPSSHTHQYAGAATAGGSANSAVKIDTATMGSATQPVYFTGGKPTPCTYTLGTSVPADAKFTDTVYTLPAASATALGGIKTGFSTNGRNYAVVLNTDNKAYVNVPWTDTVPTWANLSGKPTLATVATSGSYTDLKNTPTIPAAANNATLTIKQAGTVKGTFTANASNNVTIELTDNNTTYSSLKNPYSLTIKDGSTSVVYDGSSTKTFTATHNIVPIFNGYLTSGSTNVSISSYITNSCHFSSSNSSIITLILDGVMTIGASICGGSRTGDFQFSIPVAVPITWTCCSGCYYPIASKKVYPWVVDDARSPADCGSGYLGRIMTNGSYIQITGTTTSSWTISISGTNVKLTHIYAVVAG